MRLILAVLFVFAGITLAAGLFSNVIDKDHVLPFLGLGMSVLFVVLVIIAFVMFNPSGVKIEDFKSNEEQIQDLEDKGLLISTDFNAIRAFKVEEGEDEGPYYFIELADGSVLYLNGQYLYDYEHIEDDEEDNQPQIFPCTHFTIRRHRDEGYVVDIICRGSLIELESLEPDCQREEYRWGKIPEDGGIITNESFDELKRRIG